MPRPTSLESDPLEAPAPRVLKFERRRAPRVPAEGAALAFETGGDGFGRRHELELVDFSAGGVGAITDTMIAPGSPVTISFRTDGEAAQGQVVRCLPCGRGYRVAIAFARRRAA